MSRYLLCSKSDCESDTDHYINMIENYGIPKTISLSEIHQATQNDETLQTIIDAISHGS